jgi:hypothetical protein
MRARMHCCPAQRYAPSCHTFLGPGLRPPGYECGARIIGKLLACAWRIVRGPHLLLRSCVHDICEVVLRDFEGPAGLK